MSDIRKVRAKRNIVASVVCQIITLLCGFLVPRALLGAFGSEVYGACSSITQFLSYITLLEGGVGGVARAVLYKPLAEDDRETISGILLEIRRFFRGIVVVFGVYVVVLACAFRRISHVEALNPLSSFLLVVAISLSTFAQYSIGISDSILIQAAQRSYITGGVNILVTVVNAVSVVILVSLGCNVLTVKLISSLIYVVKPLVYWLYVRRTWHPAKVADKSKVYLTQKWNGLGQHLAFFLHSNTDVVILTCFADLKAVAVYSVYYMVVSHIQNLVLSFSSGMEAVFGDMLAKEEYPRLHRTFDSYETLLSLICTILFSETVVLIVPFIQIYTSGISDADYYAPLFGTLLSLSALLYCLRIPYHNMVIAAGHFKQTELASYGEAAINVVLSMLLVSRMGLVGVAIGTLAATAFRFLYYVFYLENHIFNRNKGLFGRRLFVNALSFVVSWGMGSLVTRHARMGNYAQWALWGIVTGVLSAAIVLGVNLAFYPESCRNLLKTAIAPGKIKNKKEGPYADAESQS